MRQNSLPALTWRVSTTASLSVLIVCEQPAGSLSRPTATFVTRLQPSRLPDQDAR